MNEKNDKKNLQDLQDYILTVCRKNGWDKADSSEKFMLLSEEVGELAKAIRKYEKIFVEKGGNFSEKELKKSIAYELADILSYLLDIANYYEINLENAFWEKEDINSKREWEKRE